MRTRLDVIAFEVAPLDVQRDESRGAFGPAADPQRRRLAGERVPVHRLEAVPRVLVARAVAFAVAPVALRPDVEGAHLFDCRETERIVEQPRQEIRDADAVHVEPQRREARVEKYLAQLARQSLGAGEVDA